MSEPTPAPATDPAATDPAATLPADSTPPPWGSDEDFNPEKAWNLIQNLRTESKEAKDKVRSFEDAQLSAQEKAERDAKELQESLASTQLENARLKALASNPNLTLEDLEFVAGSTPEEVAANAAKLAARLGSGIPATPPTQKPQPVLRGGADPVGNADEPTDWLRAALAKK